MSQEYVIVRLMCIKIILITNNSRIHIINSVKTYKEQRALSSISIIFPDPIAKVITKSHTVKPTKNM